MKSKTKSRVYRASPEWERKMRERICTPNGITLPRATLYASQTKAFDEMEKEIKKIVEKHKNAKRK